MRKHKGAGIARGSHPTRIIESDGKQGQVVASSYGHMGWLLAWESSDNGNRGQLGLLLSPGCPD